VILTGKAGQGREKSAIWPCAPQENFAFPLINLSSCGRMSVSPVARDTRLKRLFGCKKYAFGTLKLNEVYSIIRDTNFASMNVAIRNGMTVRRRFTKRYYGVDMPHYIFSVRKTDK
jgi:hypothetical protein